MFLKMLPAALTCCLLLMYQAPPVLSLVPPLETVARQYGFVVETHPQVTREGYIIGVHRLLKATETAESVKRPPVLLCHGLFQSSDTLLVTKWHYGYSLVNNGYDVWLHNYRGNLYSRQHNTLSPDSAAFHNFTMSDMGADLTHTIDYILEKTKRKQLSYIGCSMGGQLFWALGNLYPEYMNKILVFVGIGVVGYPIETTQSKFRDVLFLIESILKKLSEPEFKNPHPTIGPVIKTFCSGSGWLGRPLCDIAIQLYGGLVGYCDKECLLNLVSVSTSCISGKVLQHYFQMIKTGTMAEFSYGEQGNELVYGSKTPPLYDITKITCPIYFIAGDDDIMTPLPELEKLAGMFAVKATIDVYVGYSHPHLFMNETPVKVITTKLLSILQANHVRQIAL